MPSEWGSMIKQEIIDLKIRLTAVESQLKDIGVSPSGLKEFGGEVGEDAFPTGAVELVGFGKSKSDMTADLVSATYALKTASIAMRGYLMLLDQAGLSKDQKKMIRELEYTMMMVMKMAQAIQIAATVAAAGRAALGDPSSIVQLVIGGGYLASSLAYGSKTSGGMVS